MMKFISSDFNKDTGVTSVSISTNRGVFVGKTKLQEGDKESYMIGGNNAEWRARMAYMRERIKENRIELRMLKNFEKRLKCLKDYNPYSLECRKLRRQIYEKQAELEERISLLNSAKEKYLLVQKDYEKAMSHFNKIAEGKNN